MPTSTNQEAPLRPPFAGALAGEFFDSARQAAGAAAETYLDGLDAVTRAHRRLVAGTPLAPVSEVLGAQVALTRHILQGFVSGERRTAATPARATEAAERPALRAPRPATPKPAPRRASPKPATERADARPEATRRASKQRATRKPAARRTPAERPAPAQSRAERPGPARTQAERPAPTPAPPIPGYEGLTAEQLLARLPEVPQRTLPEIREYEAAHGARQPVLERVGALTEPEPVSGYDDLSVEDIQPRLADGDAALATRVRDYERRHKQRPVVIQAAERRLAAG